MSRLRLASWLSPLLLASISAAQCATPIDLWPGSKASVPRRLVNAFGEAVYFIARQPAYGFELHRWDPVSGITVLDEKIGGRYRPEI